MANDLEKRLLGLSPEDKRELRDKLDSEISEDDIKEAQQPKNKIIVKKFEDDRVKPYSAQAIYDVFNKKNSVETVLNGQMVIGLFGKDDDDKKKFEAKIYGEKYTTNGYRIKFRHFEIN
jgi:hypothetical protein